ncbi:MAG: helicase-related protein, partial [Nanoarchaeota archaeon]
RQEMLSKFFINANKEHTIELNDQFFKVKGSNNGGQEWRIKHHAEKLFFEWLSNWAIFMTKPSDLGYSDDKYNLPKLSINVHYVHFDYCPDDKLFFDKLDGIEDRAKLRNQSSESKISLIKELIEKENGQFIVWCGIDKESKIASEQIGDSVNVKGSDSIDYKEKAFIDFKEKKYKILITKPKIAAFGMNFQNANNMIFYGLNDSWELFYQAIRRCWRFGQDKEVNVHLVLSDQEQEIYKNILRKEAQTKRLKKEMIEMLKDYEKYQLNNQKIEITKPITEKIAGFNFTLWNGDSCEVIKELKNDSIDLSVYSPPFVDLFIYSDSVRDMGNSSNWNEFFEHYSYLCREILRVTKEGRLSCVHTSDIPAMANRDGYIGLKDFPGEVIKMHERIGWTFVGRAFIQKNPQSQAIRVKSKSLLFVQLNKDSSHSRPALVYQ